MKVDSKELRNAFCSQIIIIIIIIIIITVMK